MIFPTDIITFIYMVATLPRRLAQARRARGLSQAGLAQAAGVPHSMTISAWERGVNLPRVDDLATMAGVLGVSLDWLCGLTAEGGPLCQDSCRIARHLL